MTLVRWVLYSTLLAGAFAPRLEAQGTPLRQGAWAGIATGYGLPKVSCAICVDGRKRGFSGMVDVGAVVWRRVGLGIEASGWFHDEEGVAHRLWVISGAGYFYPSPQGGFYLKATGGYATYSAGDSTGSLEAKAPAVGLGAGWEARVAPHFLIQPYADFLTTIPTSLKFEGTKVTGSTTVTQIRFGLGVRWYGGR